MKTDGFRRSVRSSHREREAGDAPNLGRVARMPGAGRSKTKKRRRKREGSSKSGKDCRNRKAVVATWTLLIGGIAAAALGVAIWMGLKFNSGGDKPAVNLMAVQEVPKAPEIPSLTEAVALAFVKEGLACRDAGEVGRYFREGDVPPAEQVRFLTELEARDGRTSRFDWLGSLDANGLQIDGVLVMFEGPEKSGNRLVALVPDAAGKWKIDFDAFARTTTPAWGEIAAGSPPLAKVRVYVSKDSYFNGPFRDEKEWLCVGFASPDTEELLTGYCRIGTPQATALEWILSKDDEVNRAVLELQRLEGAETRQWVVSRVLAEDWVEADVPFDERFK